MCWAYLFVGRIKGQHRSLWSTNRPTACVSFCTCCLIYVPCLCVCLFTLFCLFCSLALPAVSIADAFTAVLNTHTCHPILSSFPGLASLVRTWVLSCPVSPSKESPTRPPMEFTCSRHPSVSSQVPNVPTGYGAGQKTEPYRTELRFFPKTEPKPSDLGKCETVTTLVLYLHFFVFLHSALPACPLPLMVWSLQLQLVEVWPYAEEEKEDYGQRQG